MTIDCMKIESILGPLRQFESNYGMMLSLRSVDTLQVALRSNGRLIVPLEWSLTMEPPVSDWLGSVEESGSHAETCKRMRIAAFIAFTGAVPVLADGHPWSLLDHQGGGYSCYHIQFIGRHIQLKPEIEAKCLEIAIGLYDSQLSPNPSLSQLMSYRAQLQSIGLDCNLPLTYQLLMEGFYPIDLTQSVFDRISLQPFPLESLLGTPRPLGKIEHYATLVVVAPNSD